MVERYRLKPSISKSLYVSQLRWIVLSAGLAANDETVMAVGPAVMVGVLLDENHSKV